MEATQAPDQPDSAAPEPQPEPKDRASRHARIMRGIVTPTLGLLAVASFALGALNYTVWKPDPKVTAVTPSVTQRYIVTDPGVANLGDPKVEVTVQSTSQSVCVALGEGRDVSGWVAGHSYTRLTGLSDWHDLTLEDAAAAGATSSAPSGASGSSSTGGGQSESNDVAFDKSDMWIDVQCGSGKVDVTWNVANGSQVLLVDTQAKSSSGQQSASGTPDTTVSLTWVRSKVLDLGTPFTVGGALLAVGAVAAATVFAMPPHKRRKKEKAVEAPIEPIDENETPLWARGAKPANADVELTLTGMAPIVAGSASGSSDGPSIVDVHDVNMLERSGNGGTDAAKSAEQAAAEAHDALVPSPFVGAPDEPAYGSSAADFTARDESDEPSDDTGKFDITPAKPASASESQAQSGLTVPDLATGEFAQAGAAAAESKAASETGSIPVIPDVLIPEGAGRPGDNPESANPSVPAKAQSQESQQDESQRPQSQPSTNDESAAEPIATASAEHGPEHAAQTVEHASAAPAAEEPGLASLVSSMPDPAQANHDEDEFSAVEITSQGEAIAESPEFDDYFSRLVHETQEIPPVDDQGKPKRKPRSRREMREARERLRKKKEGGRK